MEASVRMPRSPTQYVWRVAGGWVVQIKPTREKQLFAGVKPICKDLAVTTRLKAANQLKL